MPIGRCLKEHTYRQYKAWLAWLGMQWNNPDRRDWYLMQIAAEIRRGHAKHPRSVRVDQLELKFKEIKTGKAQGTLTRDQVNDQAKSRWVGFFGGKIRVKDPVTGELKRLEKPSPVDSKQGSEGEEHGSLQKRRVKRGSRNRTRKNGSQADR